MNNTPTAIITTDEFGGVIVSVIDGYEIKSSLRNIGFKFDTELRATNPNDSRLSWDKEYIDMQSAVEELKFIEITCKIQGSRLKIDKTINA